MSSATGLELKLHPLVIVNVSDHFTRIKVQAGGGALPRVLGCLLGVQTGRSVELFNSFELKYDVLDDAIVLDRAFLTQKAEQYKKVFPKYDILGWYSTGSGVAVADMAVQRALAEVNESPLYLLLDPSIHPGAKDLPIAIYESELHVIQGVPTPIFVKATYTVETVEAERISVDHVARITPSGSASGATQLAAHLMGLHSAIKMLSRRIKVLHHLLLSFSKGEVPIDHSLLRQVSSLVRRLPAIDSAHFQEEFLTEYNDTLLMTYLAGITKGTSTLNELVEKFNIAYEKNSRRGGRLQAGLL